MTSDAPIWLYDGMCVLCSRSVAFMLRHERKSVVRFVSLQSQEGRSLALRYHLDPDDPKSFLFLENGVPMQATEGLLALSAHLRAPYCFIRITKLFPSGLRDCVYHWLARNRYRLFGRMKTCMVPPPEQSHRFVMPT